MCLAMPARITELTGGEDAWVSLGDATLRVNLCMTPGAGVGDWVLVHAGFAIQRVTEADAREIWSVLDEPRPEGSREGAPA